MNPRFENAGVLFARLAMAAIFVQSGWSKLTGLDGAASYIAAQDLPVPLLLAALAGLAELAGGLALAAGFKARWAALGLALFLVPTTILFHNPVGLEAAAAHMQQIQLMKNLAIAGGLVALASFGPGRFAVDARQRSSRSESLPGHPGLPAIGQGARS
jgi:putative oxidoreductase